MPVSPILVNDGQWHHIAGTWGNEDGNAKLYFDENAGILSLGTLRAKNTVFSAIDFSKKWRNISLNPNDDRINYFYGYFPLN